MKHLKTTTFRRKKLWELKLSHHCPVVGTCLTMSDLRKLARGAALEGAEAMSDYALHHAAVSGAEHRNSLSDRMQKLLEKKFDNVVKRFAKARADEEILALWREALARGEAAAGLWAALSHAHISDVAAHQVYENLHMLSHQVGAATRGDQQMLVRLSDEVPELRAKLERNSERFARELADKEETLQNLQQRLTEALAKEARLLKAERRIIELESTGERQALLARVNTLERKLAATETRAVRDAGWTPLVKVAATHASDCNACDEKQTGRCGGSDLAGRSVLCVGGRAALYPEYRRLVEAFGGSFLIHDGGLKDSMDRLPALLARADVVVCPIDCVSHSAYYAVKRYCKRFGKPCALLDRSGLTTFRKGVEALADAPVRSTILPFFR